MATPSGRPRETERVLRVYEKEAHKYDREMRFFDRLLFAGGREWVCAQATGEVLEIGIGTGRNLPHYRDDVRLSSVELSPAMLEIARARAHELGREVDLRVGDAQALEFPDQSFTIPLLTRRTTGPAPAPDRTRSGALGQLTPRLHSSRTAPKRARPS